MEYDEHMGDGEHMEYDEQKVIDFMRLYGEILEKRCILIYCKDSFLRNRAAKDLKRALCQYKNKVPSSIKSILTNLEISAINNLEKIVE